MPHVLDKARINAMTRIELCAYLLRGQCTPAQRIRYLELLGSAQNFLTNGATTGADAEGDLVERRAGRKGVDDVRTQHSNGSSADN